MLFRLIMSGVFKVVNLLFGPLLVLLTNVIAVGRRPKTAIRCSFGA